MKQETPHPSAGETEETYSFTPEDMIEFSHWSESSDEAYLFWNKNQVSPTKKTKEKRKKLLKLWIKIIEKKIHDEQQP